MTQAILQQKVEQRLGRSVFVGQDDADILLEVKTVPNPEGQQLVTVTLQSRLGAFWGNREVLAGTDCPSLEASLVLMLSLTADIAKEEVEERVERDRLQTVSVAPMISLSGVYGLLPGFAWGPLLGVGVRSPGLGWIELGVAAYLERSLGAPARADFTALLAQLRLCPLELHGGGNSLGLCAAVRAGAVQGEGHQFEQSFRERRLLASAGFAARGVWTFSYPWFLTGTVGGDAVLQGTEFYYESAAERVNLFSTAPILFIADLGLGLTLQ